MTNQTSLRSRVKGKFFFIPDTNLRKGTNATSICEMLNDLEITISEVILFENLKSTVERLNDLEELDEDRWSTIAHLCNKIENLERNFKDLEKENKSLIKTNQDLTKVIDELAEKYSKITENQKEILKSLEILKSSKNL